MLLAMNEYHECCFAKYAEKEKDVLLSWLSEKSGFEKGKEKMCSFCPSKNRQLFGF